MADKDWTMAAEDWTMAAEDWTMAARDRGQRRKVVLRATEPRVATLTAESICDIG